MSTVCRPSMQGRRTELLFIAQSRLTISLFGTPTHRHLSLSSGALLMLAITFVFLDTPVHFYTRTACQSWNAL